MGAATAWSAPNILHQPPLEAREGQPVDIAVMVTDAGAPVVQVRLFYRTAGTQAFQLQVMNGSGFIYIAQLPGSVVLASGVEYYIEAADQAGQSETSPAVNPQLAPYHVSAIRQVSGPGLEFLSPGDGTTVTPEDAVVVVAIRADKARPDVGSIRIYFDEQDVTSRAQVSETLISLVLPEPVADGLHGLKVSLRSLDGHASESPTWSFTVRGSGKTQAGRSGQTAEPQAAAAEVRLTGNVAAESQFSLLSQRPDDTTYLSQPEGFLNRLNVNLAGRLGDMNLSGSAYLTSEEKPGRQPVDRFRLEASNGFMLMTAGDVYPTFSEYTVSNMFVRGGRLHLTSGLPGESYSQLQVVGGLTRLPIEGRYGYPGTFEQWLWGMRWVHDFLPGTGFAVNYDTLNDFAQSIQNTGNAMPVDNHAASGELHIRIPFTSRMATVLYGEYGQSFYDSEQNFTTYSVGNAYRAGLRWEWQGRSQVQVEYKRNGANFVSLANPWLIGDWEGVTGKGTLYLLNDDLALSANVDSWHDNLDQQKNHEYQDAFGNTVTAGTTRTLFWSGSVNYRLSPYLSGLFLSYSMNRQQDDSRPAPSIDNLTQVLNVGLGTQWPLPAWGHQVFFNTSYSRTGYQDASARKLSPDMVSGTWMSSLMVSLGRFWVLGGGFGLTKNQLNSSNLAFPTALPSRQTVDYTLANLRASWKIKPGEWEANAGWESTAGRDDQSSVDNTLSRITAGGTHMVASGQSLGLTLSQIQYLDRIVSSKSYQEWVANLRYSLQF